MAKLYGRQVFEATVGDRKFTFTCYGQSTSYGFRHICCEGFSNTTEARYIKKDIIAKACYYNRTWERFTYETVLRSAIDKLYESDEVKQELKDILIEHKAQKEHEECEKFCKSFEALYNGLSDKNKEHLKNGLGDNLIETQDQANAVMGIMKLMTVMQN